MDREGVSEFCYSDLFSKIRKSILRSAGVKMYMPITFGSLSISHLSAVNDLEYEHITQILETYLPNITAPEGSEEAYYRYCPKHNPLFNSSKYYRFHKKKRSCFCKLSNKPYYRFRGKYAERNLIYSVEYKGVKSTRLKKYV
eukprot:TRINITY_DN5412_c0_g1_i2.p1 TRINITY_DN5412_c0_g1~~TRINITY_DN5412_c0_g1_i2.p1  ORF type:complete len:142 (+),score=12.96 TRINITY_DN5412_c0_g1_i2:463-888(+)